MYLTLGESRLTTGEKVELGVVEAPDPDWAERLAIFLSHKPPDADYHIQAALAGPLDALETRFYVGSVDGQVITNAMIVGARGFGILGHVYTAPAWRRRRACRQLMVAEMDDVRRRGYRALTLGTGFDSHAYWTYHSLGFRPVAEGSGFMRWLADQAADLLAPGPTIVRPTRWDDWAAHSYATLEPIRSEEALPRLPLLGVTAQADVEDAFVTFLYRLRPRPGVESRVLVLETGAVVGWCHVAPGPAALANAWLLDLHALPGFEPELGRLLEGVAWPDAPIVFASDTRRAEYLECLRRAGFAEATALPGVVARAGGRRALGLWVR